MPGLVEPETVIPTLAIEHLHPVFIAIFVGALLAAIMSTADSALLAAASVFSVNIYPLFKRQVSDKQRLLVTRIAIPVFGILAVYVALEVQAVYELVMDANSVKLVCVVVPFIAGVWWKRANRTGVLASMAMGFLTWFTVLFISPEFPGDIFGLLAGLVTLLIVAPLTQEMDPPRPLRNGKGEEVQFKDRLGSIPIFSRSR
jgi:Na+/proline symporter